MSARMQKDSPCASSIAYAPIWNMTRYKSALVGLIASLWVVFLLGCTPGGMGTAQNAASPAAVPTVHMKASQFAPASITLAKGAKLLLIDENSVLHILANGAWENGVAVPKTEEHAPVVDHLQTSGQNIEIGPFTTAGTYHIYCLLHFNMNLVVQVA